MCVGCLKNGTAFEKKKPKKKRASEIRKTRYSFLNIEAL